MPKFQSSAIRHQSSDKSKKGFKFGFTLVELLVVIAIIAVLAVVGIVIFTNVQKGVRDVKRKADIDAIVKAYEVKYNPTADTYSSLVDADFSAGRIPTPPEGGTYTCVVGPVGCTQTSTQGFKVCATLEGGTAGCTGGANCYCKASTRGALASSGLITTCDPTGALGVGGGLVGYWKMNESSGTSVSDSAGSTTLSTTGSPTFVLGKFGNALSLNGTSQYASVSTAAGSAVNPLSQITISAWIRPAAAQLGYFVSRNGPYSLGMQTDRKIQFNILTGGILGSPLVSSSTILLNSWSHVVGSYDGSNMWIYINGTAETPLSKSGNMDQAAKTFYIGFGDCAFCNFFSGLVDDVRIYNRALTGSEVSCLSTLTP